MQIVEDLTELVNNQQMLIGDVKDASDHFAASIYQMEIDRVKVSFIISQLRSFHLFSLHGKLTKTIFAPSFC